MAALLEMSSVFGDPQQLLLELAGFHHLPTLLSSAVDRLAESPAVALARIWLIRPPLPGDCAKCLMAGECHDRQRCLHLVASAGQSLDKRRGAYDRLDGSFRRFPLGVRKIGHIAQSGEPLEVLDVESTHPWVADPQWIRSEKVVALAGHPLVYRDEVLGVFAVFARAEPGESCFAWLRMIANHLAAAIANARALDEIERLRRQLELENDYLREEVKQTAAFGELIGHSPALQAVTRQIELVAPTDASVLILGESGTGKELVARELHRRSQRADRPFIKVNCAAVPRELYESEFFGHTKGSFTGALRDRIGRFELADGGTLFLDEVGEIPLALQPKLLRVLQEGEFERVGDERIQKVNVRLIAATNRNLREEAASQRFRQDLYYRLSVFPIELPPLRQRSEDITVLAEHFVDRISRRLGRARPRLTLAAMQKLQSYSWPGNIRELQHVLERACIVSTGGRLQIELPEHAPAAEPPAADASLQNRILRDAEIRALEQSNISSALAACGGKIYGLDGAAALLDMKPTTLASRIKALGISK